MSKCIAGREVVINLRDRGTRNDEAFHLVCPGSWTRDRLLAYCRAEHPNCTVRILDWLALTDVPDKPWRTRLWLVNPEEMVKR